jgi:glycosyltransferase involved in cell wall biosynthesis
MRLVLISLSARGGILYGISALLKELPRMCEVIALVPCYYPYQHQDVCLQRFEAGQRHQNLARYSNPLWALKQWQRVRAMRPDIVFVYYGDGYPCTLLWSKMNRFERLPMLIGVHDPDPHPGTLTANLLNRIGRYTWRSGVSLCVFSRCFVQTLIQQGIPPERVFYVPLIHDLEPFTQFRSSPPPQREPFALFFGRLEYYKGLDILIEAAKQLRAELRFVIAGPGKLPRKVHRQIIAQPSLFDLRARFIPEQEVAELLERAAVCVMPYRQATQSGIPILAAAFETPLVATATGGLVEQVQAMNGLLVPPNDPSALAEGIIKAMGCKPVFPEEWQLPNISAMYYEVFTQIYEFASSQPWLPGMR